MKKKPSSFIRSWRIPACKKAAQKKTFRKTRNVFFYAVPGAGRREAFQLPQGCPRMPETGRYQNFLPEPEWLVPEDPEKELWKVEPPEDPPPRSDDFGAGGTYLLSVRVLMRWSPPIAATRRLPGTR